MNKENLVKKTVIENPDSLLLLKNIFENNKLDITKFKMQFLKRRIERRMQIKEISDFIKYLHLLENDSIELTYLFESLSINVTSFFRDTAVFNAVRAIIVPKILSNIENDKMISVWSAGCASGEEPYSIAILLNDIFGISKKIGILKNIRIHIKATDINNKAIDFAQTGQYQNKFLEHLSTDLKKKYFTKIENHDDSKYEIISEIKDLVDFETMDILSSPENAYDVIFCRNVLIYYKKDAQELILKKFHNCLKNEGYLVLGSDEILIGKNTENIFYPVMPKEKIFQKIN
ncbi:MAG: protein-glutamate O-methyltransferase CheR [Candidatus Nitrosotalea sp.]|nr:protein-glutamate O-methyltransferase CheR [Candidatus Nitrosotalea sp.]